jgi:IS5 family transposase
MVLLSDPGADMDRLIRADDTAVYGDKGYASGARRRTAEAAGVLWAVKEKAQTGRRLTVRQRASNRRFGKVCAKAAPGAAVGPDRTAP